MLGTVSPLPCGAPKSVPVENGDMFSLLLLSSVKVRNVFADRRDLQFENAALQQQLATASAKATAPG